MYSAEKARKDASESTFDPLSEWSIFDTWEFNRIEKKIKRAAERGNGEIRLRYIGELARLKIERNGYEVVQYCGIPGTSVKPWVGIYWNR